MREGSLWDKETESGRGREGGEVGRDGGRGRREVIPTCLLLGRVNHHPYIPPPIIVRVYQGYGDRGMVKGVW